MASRSAGTSLNSAMVSCKGYLPGSVATRRQASCTRLRSPRQPLRMVRRPAWIISTTRFQTIESILISSLGGRLRPNCCRLGDSLDGSNLSTALQWSLHVQRLQSRAELNQPFNHSCIGRTTQTPVLASKSAQLRMAELVAFLPD